MDKVETQDRCDWTDGAADVDASVSASGSSDRIAMVVVLPLCPS
jgi:hypothetical protein